MKPEELQALQARLRYVLYAERVTRILCRRSGSIDGYRWREMSTARQAARGVAGYPPKLLSHRVPPLPFNDWGRGQSGRCRVCGQPVYGTRGKASFRTFAGPPSTSQWHTVCLQTYFVMTRPADYAELLILKQGNACAVSGRPIALPYPSYVEVDHEVPLFRVAREHAEEPWYELIRFWMMGNLRAITREALLAKCAEEARERAVHRLPMAGQEAML